MREAVAVVAEEATVEAVEGAAVATVVADLAEEVSISVCICTCFHD